MKRGARAEAKARGLTRYFTGKPCKNGHLAERFVNGAVCVICKAERTTEWRAAHREEAKEAERAWYRANKARRLAADKAWRKANPEKSAAIYARYRARRAAEKAIERR